MNAKSLKGPTSKMMSELGMDTSVLTVANYYSEYSNTIFLDSSDTNEEHALVKNGFQVFFANLIMNNLDSKVNLAQSVIDCLEQK